MSDSTVWVQSCAAENFDTATMTCSVPIWTPQATVFPALSIADAQTLLPPILLLWATAWVYRRLFKVLPN